MERPSVRARRFDSVPAALLALSLLFANACDHREAARDPLSAGDDFSQAAEPGARNAVLNEDFSNRQIFPADNWWNLDVSEAPLDPASDAFIAWIIPTRQLHPDFGPPPYGMPYISVAGDQPLLPITFVLYGDESDPGAPGRPPGYPVPSEARTLA